MPIVVKKIDMLNFAMTMSEGNPQALASVTTLMHTQYGMMGLILCHLANIRGVELHRLYKECCDCDPFIFERSSSMIQNGVFSKEQVRRNIYSNDPIPFVDESIEIYGVPDFGELFGPAHYKWKEYCDESRKSFSHRLNKKFFEEESKQYHK